MSLFDALKGISGAVEINRLVGALGATSYILVANGLEIWRVAWKGQPFDLAAYCGSFPWGLGTVILAIGGSIALKDRFVAQARVANAQAVAATSAGADP
jgi:hypothetical protein